VRVRRPRMRPHEPQHGDVLGTTPSMRLSASSAATAAVCPAMMPATIPAWYTRSLGGKRARGTSPSSCKQYATTAAWPRASAMHSASVNTPASRGAGGGGCGCRPAATAVKRAAITSRAPPADACMHAHASSVTRQCLSGAAARMGSARCRSVGGWPAASSKARMMPAMAKGISHARGDVSMLRTNVGTAVHAKNDGYGGWKPAACSLQPAARARRQSVRNASCKTRTRCLSQCVGWECDAADDAVGAPYACSAREQVLGGCFDLRGSRATRCRSSRSPTGSPSCATGPKHHGRAARGHRPPAGHTARGIGCVRERLAPGRGRDL
jgi:hypothetical protein